MRRIIWLLVAIVAIGPAPASAKQRWLNFDSANGVAYRAVEWDAVGVVVFYAAGPVGGRVYAATPTGLADLGTVPKNSPSLAHLRALIAAEPARWVKMWPHENG